jgi:hypothetical protein
MIDSHVGSRSQRPLSPIIYRRSLLRLGPCRVRDISVPPSGTADRPGQVGVDSCHRTKAKESTIASQHIGLNTVGCLNVLNMGEVGDNANLKGTEFESILPAEAARCAPDHFQARLGKCLTRWRRYGFYGQILTSLPSGLPQAAIEPASGARSGWQLQTCISTCDTPDLLKPIEDSPMNPDHP